MRRQSSRANIVAFDNSRHDLTIHFEFIDRYDSPAFDAHAETYGIAVFEPMVRRIFAAPKRSLYRPATYAMPAG